MYVTVVRHMSVRLGKSAQKRLHKCNEKGLCLACEQPIKDGEHVVRGIHLRCYHATLRAIKRGDFTDDQRVREGRMLQAKPGGRPPTNPVSVEARAER